MRVARRHGKNGTTPDAIKRLVPGMSLRRLARGSGLSVTLLSKVVNGRRRLTMDTAKALAAFLRLPLQTVVEALDATKKEQAA
jgi:transcriptional regulator with XRE-family HTH domain